MKIAEGLKDVSWPPSEGKQDGVFKLDRIKKALKILGNPEKKIPFPIHIVGTNGKGSTISFLEAILKEASFKSHVYTSPNLIYLNERIKLAGNEISNEKLEEILNKTRELLAQENFEKEVSFFEGFTAASFLAFSEEKADFSLIEAGLGGRFDATNVMDSKLCILTSISFDHTEYLGETVKEIAEEKLAVERKDVPFVVSFQPYKEVYDYAKNCIIYGKDFHITPNENGFEYSSKNSNFLLPKPSLAGYHQYYNAGTAIKACEILNEFYGFNITQEHIKNGVQKAIWRARLQKLHIQKFPNLEIFLDGAHNENGVETLVSEINNTASNFVKNIVICGFLKRKDLTKIAPKILNLNAEIYTTSIHSSQESKGANELSQIFSEFGIKVQGFRENFYEILQEIANTNFQEIANKNLQEIAGETLQKIAGEKIRVVIFGSLYLAGEVLEWCEKQ